MATAPFIITTELNLDKFKEGADRLRAEILKLQQEINSTKTSLTKITTIPPVKLPTKPITDMSKDVPQVGKDVDILNASLKNTSNALSDVGRRVFVWGSFSALIFGALQNLKEFYAFTLKMDTELGELKKILPKVTDFDFLKSESFKFSIEFGKDPAESLKMLRTFAQAGLNVEESIKATRSALLALNTTGADTETAIDALIGANRLFNISWENMASVVDKVQKIQADFAVDAKDLISSITAIGPSITVLGGNIDDLFSMIAGMGEAARISGKEASNALKRVFSKIATDEGILALQNVGIAVMKTADSFRPLRDIMGDLNVKWEDLSNAQKQNLSLVLADVRQYAKFQAMLANSARAQEALTKSQNAYGEALTANDIIMQTWEKRQAVAGAQMKMLFERFMSNSGLVEGLTLAKEAFGGTAAVIQGGFGKAISTSLLSVGLYAAGLLALRKMVIGFNKDNQLLFSKMSTKNLLTQGFGTALTAQTKVGQTEFTGFISKGARIAGMLGYIGIAAAVLLPIMGSLITYFKKSTAIFDDAVQGLEAFKKSLENVNIVGAFGADTDKKYSIIIDTFKQLGIGISKAGISVDQFTESFSKLIPEFDKLDKVKQVEKLKELLEKVSSFFGSNYVETIQRGLAKSSILIDDYFKESIVAYDNFYDKLKKNKKLQEDFLSLKSGKIPMPSGISGGISEEVYLRYRKQKNLFTDLILDLKDITQWSGNFYEEFTKASKGFEKFNVEIKKITNLKEQINEITFKDLSTEEAKNKLKDLNSEMENSIKNASDILLGLVDVEELTTKAISAARSAISVKAGSPLVSEASSMADVMKKVTDEVLKLAEIRLGTDEFSKLHEELKKIIPTLGVLGDTTKAWVAEVSPTSVLSSLKKTFDSVVLGFQAQLSTIEETSSALSRAGLSYNKYVEGVKAADSAIQEMITKNKNNAENLKSISLEIETMKSLLSLSSEGGANLPDNQKGFFDPKNISDAVTKLSELRAQEATLLEINKTNNKELDKYLDYIVKIKEAYSKVVEQQKANEQILKSATDITRSLFEGTKSFNEIFSNDPFKAFKEGEKIYEQLLQYQIEFTRMQGENVGTSKDIIKSEIEQLKNDAKIETLNRAIKLILTETEGKWKRITDLAKEYSGVQKDIKEKIIEARLEMDKTGKRRGYDDILSLEIKALKEKRKASMEELAANEKRLGLSKEVTNYNKAVLEMQLSAEEVEIRINDILEKRSALYSVINDDVTGIKNSIVDWLTDQGQLIDDLGSRMGVFKALGRAASSIKKVMSQQDAQIIAESLTGNIEKFVGKVRTGITKGLADAEVTIGEELTKSIESTKLPADIEKALTNGNNLVMSGIYSAWEKVAKDIFPQFPEAVFSSMDELLANIKNTNVSISIPEFEGLAGLNQDFFKNLVAELILAMRETKEQIEKLGISEKTVGGIKAQLDKDIPTTQPADALKVAPTPVIGVEKPLDKSEFIKAAEEQNKKNGEVVTKLMGTLIQDMNVRLKEGVPKDMDISSLTFTDKKLEAIKLVSGKMALELKKNSDVGINVKSESLQALGRLFSSFASQVLGDQLAKSMGRSSDLVEPMSAMGSLAGSAIGGPVGGVIGALAGGILGALFGKKEEKKEEEPTLEPIKSIEKNTAKLVDMLSPDLFNAPANYIVPSGTGRGNSITISNTFNLQGNKLNNDTIDKLEKQINEAYSRSNRSNSILG